MPRNTIRAWREDDDHDDNVIDLARFRPLADQEPTAQPVTWQQQDDPPPPRDWLRYEHMLDEPCHWQNCGRCRREHRGLACTMKIHLDNGCDLFDESDRRYWAMMNEQLDPEHPDDTLAARPARRSQDRAEFVDIREPRKRVTRRRARP